MRTSSASKLIDIKPDGSFRLDTDYFGFLDSTEMMNERFASLFGGPRAHAGVAHHAPRDEPRGLGAGGDRGDRDPAGAARARLDRARESRAWPAASR